MNLDLSSVHLIYLKVEEGRAQGCFTILLSIMNFPLVGLPLPLPAAAPAKIMEFPKLLKMSSEISQWSFSSSFDKPVTFTLPGSVFGKLKLAYKLQQYPAFRKLARQYYCPLKIPKIFWNLTETPSWHVAKPASSTRALASPGATGTLIQLNPHPFSWN